MTFFGDDRHDLDEIAHEGCMHVCSSKWSGQFAAHPLQHRIGGGSTEKTEFPIELLCCSHIANDMANVMDGFNVTVHGTHSFVEQRRTSTPSGVVYGKSFIIPVTITSTR